MLGSLWVWSEGVYGGDFLRKVPEIRGHFGAFFDFFQNRPEMCLGGSGGTEGTPGDPWEPLNCSETPEFPGFRGSGNFPLISLWAPIGPLGPLGPSEAIRGYP